MTFDEASIIDDILADASGGTLITPPDWPCGWRALLYCTPTCGLARFRIGLALEKWRANFSPSGGGLEQDRAFVSQGRVPPGGIIEPVDECANGTFCLPS